MNIDSFRAARIGLILGGILMVGLLAWFFFAKVGLYEISQEVSFNEEGRLMATFRPESIARIHVGQPAILRVYGGGDQPPITIQGVVWDTPPDTNQAEIYVMNEDPSQYPLQGGVKAQAEVQIESVTPFTLVLRSTGKYVGGNPITVGPQPVETSVGE